VNTIEHTIIVAKDETLTIPAHDIAPGLVLFRLPDGMAPNNPRRWRIGHRASGLAIADAMRQEDGIAGIHKLAELADWTQDKDTLLATLSDSDVFIKLSYVDCIEPNADRMTVDVSRNGTYTDADLSAAAGEYEGLDCLQILNEMAHTVPWMGLDTEPFNEAHNRICQLADAA
jgi:hypothetical protein